MLGICLGHQGLGHALKGWVTSAPTPMHGRLSDVKHLGAGLFEGIPQDFSAVRYHSLAVSGPIGPNGRVTAWTGDGVVMGIEHTERPLWGVQFHPESISTEHGARLIENFYRLARECRPAGRYAPAHAAGAAAARRRRAAEGAQARLSVRALEGEPDTEKLFERLFGSVRYAFWLDSADGHAARAGSSPWREPRGQGSGARIRRAAWAGNPPRQNGTTTEEASISTCSSAS